MAKHLKSILAVSVTTFGSRVLGLVRDSLSYAIFGVAAINSAFVFAWSLPNLFRRLLGEGALNSSFIPVLSDALQAGGRAEAFRFLNQVISRLLVVLAGLVLLSMAILAAARHFPGLEPQWYLSFNFGVVLMPYLLLVCVTAALLAALNVLGYFAVSAMSQVWINVAMILSLAVFAQHFGRTDMEKMYWQCGGVLAGGLMQVLMPSIGLWREGWRPRWDWTPSPRLSEMMRLLLPGVFGASITQINIFISGCFALGLNESARTEIYASTRLMELPLGMFTVAFATVLFPKIAMMAAQGDKRGMAGHYAQGLRLIFAITVPAALGLVVLREPVVRVLFEYGKFGEQAVLETTPLVAISALSIPFFSLLTLATRGFYAQKDMRTPLRVAYWTFAVNLILTITLMHPLGTSGLVLANLLSAIFQSLVLQRLLLRQETPLARPHLKKALIAIGLAGMGMLIFTFVGWEALRWGLGEGRVPWLLHLRICDLAAVAILIPASMLAYLALLRAAKFEDWPQLQELVTHLLARRN